MRKRAATRKRRIGNLPTSAQRKNSGLFLRGSNGGGGKAPPVPLPRQCAQWLATVLWQVVCGAAFSQRGALRDGPGTAGTVSEVDGRNHLCLGKAVRGGRWCNDESERYGARFTLRGVQRIAIRARRWSWARRLAKRPIA